MHLTLGLGTVFSLFSTGCFFCLDGFAALAPAPVMPAVRHLFLTQILLTSQFSDRY
jgi:hypothetical protein